MEREIWLRRGKRVDNGKWVYGNIVFTRGERAFTASLERGVEVIGNVFDNSELLVRSEK